MFLFKLKITGEITHHNFFFNKNFLKHFIEYKITNSRLLYILITYLFLFVALIITLKFISPQFLKHFSIYSRLLRINFSFNFLFKISH